MIVYKDIISRLAAAGYTTYKIRKDKLISEGTMQRLRENKPISTDTIDTLCRLLDTQPGELIEYVPGDA
jgi:putative transcriptional regulator